jgi:hypothetical protein
MGRRSCQVVLILFAAIALGFSAVVLCLTRSLKRIRSSTLPDDSLTLVRHGYRAVPAITAARFLAERLPGRISFRTAVPSVLLAADWPALLDIVVRFISPGTALNGASALPGLAILTTTNFLMLAAGWLGWRMFINAVPEIDQLIELAAERLKLRSWIRRRLGLPRQLVACIIFVAAVAAIRELNSASHVSLLSQIVVGWSVAVGTNTLYWIVTWAEGPVRLYRCTSLKLNWYDGARTPGMRCLQRIYSFIAMALGAGVLAAEGFSLLVADKYGSAMPPTFWEFLPIALAALALYAGAGPFFFLYLIIRRERETVLRHIGRQLDRFTSEQLDHPSVKSFLDSYYHVSAMSTWPLTSATVAEYVAAVVGSLLAYALGRF